MKAKVIKSKSITTSVDRLQKRNARPSAILSTVHETVKGLRKSGLVSKETMREFDALCLSPIQPLRPSEIAALRLREGVSQPVFAAYLNVAKTSVSKWERGENTPEGPALKLLTIVKNKGLKAIA